MDKLNLLFFRSKEGQEDKYQKELAEISTILSQDQYQHLLVPIKAHVVLILLHPVVLLQTIYGQ